MLWIALFFGVLALAAACFVLVAIADRMTCSKRRRVEGTPADLDLRYEEIQFLTSDRFTLRGWYLDCPGARGTIVLVHDVEATRGDSERRFLHLQRDYIRRGWSVFAFDLRGHGESAGQRDSFGCCEQLDVQAAVAYVRRRSPGMPVILHGFGFGAALSIKAAANGVEVAGVIADSPFLSMRAYLRERWQHLPWRLFAVAAVVARRCFGADIDALQPIKVVGDVPVPVLFIHNEDDPEVPLAHTLNLAANSLDPRDRVWIVPHRAGHATGYREAPDMYMRRCLDFLDEVIPARVLVAQAV
jgi:uncharacterized protein